MEIKKLGFGLMRLPLLDENDKKSVDMEQVRFMVDEFISRGFTYFDTAYMYHEFTSEIVAREALVKRYPRESFTLTSKMPTMFLEKAEDMDRIFSEQLEKCGVEYFDYYLLHNHRSLIALDSSKRKKRLARSVRLDFLIMTMQTSWKRY